MTEEHNQEQFEYVQEVADNAGWLAGTVTWTSQLCSAWESLNKLVTYHGTSIVTIVSVNILKDGEKHNMILSSDACYCTVWFGMVLYGNVGKAVIWRVGPSDPVKLNTPCILPPYCTTLYYSVFQFVPNTTTLYSSVFQCPVCVQHFTLQLCSIKKHHHHISGLTSTLCRSVFIKTFFHNYLCLWYKMFNSKLLDCYLHFKNNLD